MRRRSTATVLAWMALASPVLAQPDRYDLGQRLRAFEATLEQHPGIEGRRRALDPVQRATSLFFLGQLGEAMRQMDRARHAVTSPFASAPAVQWADATTLRPERRLLDASAAGLPCTLSALYRVADAAPADASWEVTLSRGLNKRADAASRQAVASLPQRAELPFTGETKRFGAGLPQGDYQLAWSLHAGGETLTQRRLTVSLVTGLDERLRRLDKAVASFRDQPASTERATVRALAELLHGLRDGTAYETDYPAARLLAEAEAAVDALQAGRQSFGLKRPGQFWLTLAVEEGVKPVRLLAPAAAERGAPLPLVIALHGAKGSENLFFDGYGHGKIATLCEERGWLLVAPRDGYTPGLIDAVDRLYPVDRQRVFLVGHSMGAAQAMAAAGRRPQDFAAVAALGGGGPVADSAAFRQVRCFVGVGAQDFLLAPARRLRDNLKKAGVGVVEYREYADVEHLMVVQLALAEVFRFFAPVAP